MICAGIDEVGRGCLAGPVVACAVILPKDFSVVVMDSKKCSPVRRKRISEEIKVHALDYAFGMVDAEMIDIHNIRIATLMAMAQALSQLKQAVDIVYIDGNVAIPRYLMQEYHLTCRQETIVNGDSLNTSISSASILAKVYRDEYMSVLSERYPEYGFSKHKGYGTKEHRDALKRYGACPLHRKTFSGVL